MAGLVLVLSLSLAPNTDSFQLQGVVSGFLAAKDTARACPIVPQALAPCCFGRGARASMLRSADAAVLRAGAADFVLDSFDPEEEEDELSCENLLKVVYSETTDQHVNDLVWKALGENARFLADTRIDTHTRMQTNAETNHRMIG